jgi:hypothetical protein
MLGRKKVCHGTPIDGLYLALAGRRVNLRGTSLVSDEEDKRKKMKKVMIVLTILLVFTVSAFAEMGALQGGGMVIHGRQRGSRRLRGLLDHETRVGRERICGQAFPLS